MIARLQVARPTFCQSYLVPPIHAPQATRATQHARLGSLGLSTRRPPSQPWRCHQQAPAVAAAAPVTSTTQDEGECPIECVREIRTLAEWDALLEATRTSDQLVIVDFFKRACGACKYIQPGFVKLCNQAASEHQPVVFIKHNVVDEDDGDEDQTELAHQLRIKSVPMFKFYRNAVEIDSFATRDRDKVAAAINRHMRVDVVSLTPEEDAE